MKKILIGILILMLVTLTACSANAISSAPFTQTRVDNTAATQTNSSTILNTSYDNAVSIATQLAVGTLNLDGTANAVNTDQATVMIPLWENLQALTQQAMPGQNGGSQAAPQGPTNATPDPSAGGADQSSTTTGSQATSNDSQTQVDALVSQIEAAMTTDQLNAIAAMQLTQTTVASILQAKGITTSAPRGNGTTGNGNPQLQGTPSAAMGTQDASQQPSGQQPGNGQLQGNGISGQDQPGNGQMGSNTVMIQMDLLNGVIEYLANIAGVTIPTSQSQSNTGTPGGNTTETGSSTVITKVKAAYTVDGKEDNQSGQTYTATAQDTSAVFVTDSGKLTLNNATVTTTGNTSSTDNSSFYGLNAGVLVNQGASLDMSGSTVTTSGTGANGVFSSGTSSNVNLSNSTITASGDGGHAVMGTLGGTMTITNVNMTTTGGSSSAIATDRGGSTINVTGGTVNTSGNNSAGIYSTGVITVNGTKFNASGAEAAVIEGANSITLTDADLTSTMQNKWGVLIYQSMSGDAQGTEGTFTMTGGSLTLSALGGPLFYVTNSTGNILLKGVELNVVSGILLNAASGSWGNTGSNGGNAIVTADGQTLTGDVTVDANSTAKITLQNSSMLTGALNSARTAKEMDLTVDSTSLWNVTADSHLTCLTDASGISGNVIANINGNGHTVYYDKTFCSALDGLTYSLKGSGTLQPVE